MTGAANQAERRGRDAPILDRPRHAHRTDVPRPAPQRRLAEQLPQRRVDRRGGIARGAGRARGAIPKQHLVIDGFARGEPLHMLDRFEQVPVVGVEAGVAAGRAGDLAGFDEQPLAARGRQQLVDRPVVAEVQQREIERLLGSVNDLEREPVPLLLDDHLAGRAKREVVDDRLAVVAVAVAVRDAANANVDQRRPRRLSRLRLDRKRPQPPHPAAQQGDRVAERMERGVEEEVAAVGRSQLQPVAGPMLEEMHGEVGRRGRVRRLVCAHGAAAQQRVALDRREQRLPDRVGRCVDRQRDRGRRAGGLVHGDPHPRFGLAGEPRGRRLRRADLHKRQPPDRFALACERSRRGEQVQLDADGQPMHLPAVDRDAAVLDADDAEEQVAGQRGVAEQRPVPLALALRPLVRLLPADPRTDPLPKLAVREASLRVQARQLLRQRVAHQPELALLPVDHDPRLVRRLIELARREQHPLVAAAAEPGRSRRVVRVVRVARAGSRAIGRADHVAGFDGGDQLRAVVGPTSADRQRVDVAQPRPGVAAVEDDGHVVAVAGQLVDELAQLEVADVDHVGLAAVVRHDRLVVPRHLRHAAGVRPRPVPAVVQQVRRRRLRAAGLAPGLRMGNKVRTDRRDDAGPRGLLVAKDLHIGVGDAERSAEHVGDQRDVVHAAGERLQRAAVLPLVDADQQRSQFAPWRHRLVVPRKARTRPDAQTDTRGEVRHGSRPDLRRAAPPRRPPVRRLKSSISRSGGRIPAPPYSAERYANPSGDCPVSCNV